MYGTAFFESIYFVHYYCKGKSRSCKRTGLQEVGFLFGFEVFSLSLVTKRELLKTLLFYEHSALQKLPGQVLIAIETPFFTPQQKFAS